MRCPYATYLHLVRLLRMPNRDYENVSADNFAILRDGARLIWNSMALLTPSRRNMNSINKRRCPHVPQQRDVLSSISTYYILPVEVVGAALASICLLCFHISNYLFSAEKDAPHALPKTTHTHTHTHTYIYIYIYIHLLPIPIYTHLLPIDVHMHSYRCVARLS